MSRFLKTLSRVRWLGGVFISFALINQPVVAQSKPNILVIIADDLTHNDLSIYGGTNVRTPHVDKLASEGLIFNRAYISMSMCYPARAELYTGLYPASNGVCWNKVNSREGTKSLPHHLGALGYRVGLAGKRHIVPESVYPFEWIDGVEPRAIALTADFNPGGIRAFVERDKKEPFCLVVALTLPHAPWTVGDPSHFDVDKLRVPPYLADTPETRKDLAAYLAEIEVFDDQVGRILDVLDETGQAEETLVLLTSEQGAQFPGCKWTIWNLGVHTGFVVRWPGRVAGGTRTNALIQYADVLPTLVDCAGGDPQAAGFDGKSFKRVLTGEVEKHREYAYFMHNNQPEGPPYPSRGVSNGEFHYIRNLTPEKLYIERHIMGSSQYSAYWLPWVFVTPENPQALSLIERYMKRPPEELYNTLEDPEHLKNLAGDPGYTSIRSELSGELDRWMNAEGDPGASLDTFEQQRNAKQGRHFKQ